MRQYSVKFAGCLSAAVFVCLLFACELILDDRVGVRSFYGLTRPAMLLASFITGALGLIAMALGYIVVLVRRTGEASKWLMGTGAGLIMVSAVGLLWANGLGEPQ